MCFGLRASPAAHVPASFPTIHTPKDVAGRFLKCAMTVSQAEQLLATTFTAFAHPKADYVVHRATSRYTLPADLADKIAFGEWHHSAGIYTIQGEAQGLGGGGGVRIV